MNPQKTAPDWLRFRTRSGPEKVLEAMAPMFGEFGRHLSLGKPQRGILGFQMAQPVMCGTMALGRVDHGGESQRGWFRWDIPGQGCQWVRDWDAIDSLVVVPDTELRRTDIALTTWRGEVTHERVVQAHADGKFITNGRPPKMRQIVSSEPKDGRTCEIGVRERSTKFGRFYEKGRKWAAESSFDVELIDGCPVEDIYRCEIEYKAQKEVPLTWDLIARRDEYFAGSYPFCAEILPGVEPEILRGRPEDRVARSLASALHNVKVQFGATLFTALHVYDGDYLAVWDRIVGDRHCQALVEAGALMVENLADLT